MESSKRKATKNKELQGINSFFDAMKDYFVFLVTLSSSFEILATILEGLSQENIINNFEFTLYSNIGLAFLFIGGLVPSIIGLLYISFGKKFVALENTEKAKFTYAFVKNLAIYTSIGFLIGFSFIAIPKLIDTVLFNFRFGPISLLVLIPPLLILILITFVYTLVRKIVELDDM